MRQPKTQQRTCALRPRQKILGRLARWAAGLCWLPVAVWAHGPLHGQIAELDSAMATSSDLAPLLLRRAELHLLDGNRTNALADVTAAGRLRPDLPELWWVRGRVALDAGRFAEALPDLDRWLERHPRHNLAMVRRAAARSGVGDVAGAVQDCSAAIALADRPDPDLFLMRARLLRQLGPDRYREALRGLDEGIARLGELVVLQLEAIDLERALGDFDPALRRLERMIGQAARKETWRVRKAELLTQAGRPEAAADAWRQALAECLSLPPGRRQTRFVQELERRIRNHLTPEALADADRQAAAVVLSPSATVPVNSRIRTLPRHEVSP